MSQGVIEIKFAGPLGPKYKPAILRAATLVFSSVESVRAPDNILVIVKRLHSSSDSANPTGLAEYRRREVILRIDTNPKNYPCLWEQSNSFWPRIRMRNVTEAVTLIAAHEFAHIALRAEKLVTQSRYNNYSDFEEWLCENIAITSLLITRGVVLSSLK